ncbi:hypothetical protein MPNT_20117 [Candidatus Methylacidithermus pantelleriae]|uniref:Uncharacterized protein n=1 Tax=Candidatus Methylacidithermus pantelleriae TaxID=2744239 RepID=A0A8J2BNH1_9BACT|nr:hypothetical protein MPNT_20117 [Candidatus Methylacidithermus pantelleriae]
MAGSNALHRKKRRLAIVPTKRHAFLANEESRAAESLFRFPRILFVKSFRRKNKGYGNHAHGKGSGRQSTLSLCVRSGRRTRSTGTSSAQRHGIHGREPIGLRLRLPEGWGSLSQ